MRQSRTAGILFTFGCLLILGIMPLLANAKPQGTNGLVFTIWLTAWQLASALPLLFVEQWQKPKQQTSHRPHFQMRTAAIALLTSAMFGLSTYMYILAAEKAGAVNMIIALQSYPLIALATEALLLGKRKSATEIGFTVLIVMALVYLVTGGTLSAAQISFWSLFTLCIPLIWTLAHLLLKNLLMTMPVTPSQVTVSRLFLSLLFLLAVQAAVGVNGSLVAAAGNWQFMLAAIAFGVAYYFELLLWFYAMRHIDVSLASTITVPAPAITMLVSALYLDETVHLYQIAAMLLASCGIYGLIIAGKRREARERVLHPAT